MVLQQILSKRLTELLRWTRCRVERKDYNIENNKITNRLTNYKIKINFDFNWTQPLSVTT